jgi:hypothetical protein
MLRLRDKGFWRYIVVFSSTFITCVTLFVLGVEPFFFCRVGQFAVGYASCLPQGLVDTILDKASKLDTNTFSILDNFPVTKDSVDLVPSNLLRISAQQSQSLFLLQSIGAW